ncbi:Uncharacterized protein APZ42_033434 [Daphnia magna]|uniref:Uncharacterized protein n=1 Tax=Daphnia magna TaxID=35525 RepID=A0A164L3W1_9CRUS|nr:Uncharacterized protein APZ42_033434 [Daphnia magna]
MTQDLQLSQELERSYWSNSSQLIRIDSTKQRERKQGIEEFTIEYFYDILDLCRRVDPNMTEATKLAHLWRGLKQSLHEKFWSLKPNS